MYSKYKSQNANLSYDQNNLYNSNKYLGNDN